MAGHAAHSGWETAGHAAEHAIDALKEGVGEKAAHEYLHRVEHQAKTHR